MKMLPIFSSLPAMTQAGTTNSADIRAAPDVPSTANTAVPDATQLKQAVEDANAALKNISSELEFTADPSTGKTVVRVIDRSTQQVIRQFPSEEMLAIARAIDRVQGILIHRKA
jgi:flagellar protein FlaG